ncbi:uncharacterized protein TRIADDRAFT_59779 [Trichoplax adhaerens]|uniref:Suppressor of forked domain-containing protein n=1 Tax=Trichoplax adhaerens TaxID=10228 RepID=B3S6E7_TRIAD|nr:hypothetical protein TRIADDRAFT_59779 [Trichoplax adhaerens]EDV21608.1 hypothetical protein TRIADDRAFT_59779 [Trichoplax adhaerens]|eukprot:XP_002115756.1 hypothetical protein TRIADDRAFT_59779 [Trichoplax adhaerens]
MENQADMQVVTQQQQQQDEATNPTADGNATAEDELEAYWKPVRQNSSDFDSWTYLLQYVEKKEDFSYISGAYNEFFKHYPYCYGYWKKYAELAIKYTDSNQVLQIYEAGVNAIPLSIDLWESYLSFFSKSVEESGENRIDEIRGLYQRAIATAGLEFISDVLWNSYIAWEKGSGLLKNVIPIFDQILKIPTRQYGSYILSLTDFINNNTPEDILSEEDLASIQSEIASSGDAEQPITTESVRAWLIKPRQALYSANEEEVKKRWGFEDKIKRPYFHVKPLEQDQLKNWREYLDFEIEQGDQNRIRVLFERCLIACALYEEFWLKYAKYMEDCNPKSSLAVFEKACTVHLPRKHSIHIAWATAEEKFGNFDRADDILKTLLDRVPDLAVVTMHRINLARRRGNADNINGLYSDAISNSKSSLTRSLYISQLSKYHLQESEALYWQLLDLELSQPGCVDKTRIEAVFSIIFANDALPSTCKEEFSRMRLNFLEDFETDIGRIKEAYESHETTYNVDLPKYTNSRKRPLEDGQSDTQAKQLKSDSAADPNAIASAPTTPNPMGVPDPSMYYQQQQQWAAYGQGGYAYPQPNAWGGYQAFPTQ